MLFSREADVIRLRERAEAAETALRELREWQPIETAPRDRTVMFCRRIPHAPIAGYWNGESNRWTLIGTGGTVSGYEDCDFLGWTPMPPLPAVRA